MKRSYMSKTAVFVATLFSILSTMATADAQSPVLYHEPFENLDFMKEDVVEHAKIDYRTIESRKLSITDGRFGKALHLGNPTTPYPYDPAKNKTLAWSVIGQNIFNNLMDLKGYKFDANGPNWSGPFLWATEKINPSN